MQRLVANRKDNTLTSLAIVVVDVTSIFILIRWRVFIF